MSVLHVITGLNVGGAETMLAKLIEHSADDPWLTPKVLSLMVPGRLAERIRAAGVEVQTARMQQGLPTPGSALRVARIGRRLAPTLVQGWMHHGNLAASLAAAAVPARPPVVWNIRHSLVDIAHEKPLSRLVLKLGRTLSRTPAAIIYNSVAAARQFEAFGFAPERTVVIPNGFDCSAFAPRAGAHAELRRRFGIASAPLVIAMVARMHPMKDAANLVEAIGRARAAGHDLHLLMAGTGTDALEQPLADLIRAVLPPDRITLAGERNDVAAWLPGVDVLALPSAWGEAFPNIVGEAMACGVPCVVTDVGDSAAIVGDCGIAVPACDPAALADGLVRMARLGPGARAALGEKARRRVLENYTLDRVAARYAALYDGIWQARAERSRAISGTPDTPATRAA